MGQTVSLTHCETYDRQLKWRLFLSIGDLKKKNR